MRLNLKKTVNVIIFLALFAYSAFGQEYNYNERPRIPAKHIKLDHTAFGGVLSSADTDVQKALDSIDDMVISTIGPMTADIDMNSHKLTGLSVPASNGDSIRATAKITETILENLYDIRLQYDADYTLLTSAISGTTYKIPVLNNYSFQKPVIDKDTTVLPASPTKGDRYLLYSSPLVSYTKSLLHFNGSDGSTTFTDEINKSWSGVGTAQLDTAQKKFDTASLLLDGNSDYITTTDSDDWNFGAGDFTVDFWVRFNSITGYQFFYTHYQDVNNRFFIYKTDAHKLAIGGYAGSVNKGEFVMTNAWSGLATNTWYHLAFVRSGSNAYIFIDGVSQALTQVAAFSTYGDITASLDIGRYITASPYYFNGWMDEFRVSKGIARWTAGFSVPTEEYGDEMIGDAGSIVEYNGSTWDEVTATEGIITWVQDENLYYCYNGSTWDIGAIHARSHAITSTSDHTSSATSGRILKADSNGLPINATNTDTDVADAVTKKHTQNTDTKIIAGDTEVAITDAGTGVIAMKVDNAVQVNVYDGKIEPNTDNDVDLGSSSKEYKDGYIDGILYADAISMVNQIDEFSTDGTMAGNSATAVPTEQATKTYTDSFNKFSVGSFSRDLSTADGDVSYTGLGFTPKAISFVFSWVGNCIGQGFDDGATHASHVSYGSAAPTYIGNSWSVSIAGLNAAGSAIRTGYVKSFDADGFTITWAGNSGMTGTLNVSYKAER